MENREGLPLLRLLPHRLWGKLYSLDSQESSLGTEWNGRINSRKEERKTLHLHKQPFRLSVHRLLNPPLPPLSRILHTHAAWLDLPTDFHQTLRKEAGAAVEGPKWEKQPFFSTTDIEPQKPRNIFKMWQLGNPVMQLNYTVRPDSRHPWSPEFKHFCCCNNM